LGQARPDAESRMMSAKKAEHDKESPSPNRWLITYTDLCILLMTFFVLLISMSRVDQKRERKAMNSLVGAFGLLPGGRSPTGTAKTSSLGEPGSPMQKKESLDLKLLRDLCSDSNLEADVYAFKNNEKIVIRINQKELFRPGAQELNPAILPFLTRLTRYIAYKQDSLEIRGHTDTYEDMNAANWSQHSWDVSANRAMAVYNFFQGQGIPAARMSAHGFSYYQPLLDSVEYPQLRHKNQRVEIVLGPNEGLPSALTEEKPTLSPYFNYKNFFFKLYPMPAKATGLPGAVNGS
jgi:chemotaxis protein MotB